MSVKCQRIIQIMEQFAPKNLAEDWDSVGLQVGDPTSDIKGILVALDLNRQVLEEAIELGANMIITHHPLIFKPLKNIRADLPQGNMLGQIIKNDISVYCAHTNLDSAKEGVNHVLAELFQLENVEILNPDKIEKIFKIVVFVPESHVDSIRSAMTSVGAGWLGNYSDCTFSVAGIGTFKGNEGSNPFIGRSGDFARVAEIRLETVAKEKQVDRIIRAMIKAHPYEEVAYDVYPLANDAGQLGLGRVGMLKKPVKLREFMNTVKEVLEVGGLRYGGNPEDIVQKIAVCGGSGASFIYKAAFCGADLFLTGDLKYHEAQEAITLGLKFVDAGHYATEKPVVQKVVGFLADELALESNTIALHCSKIESDPFCYF